MVTYIYIYMHIYNKNKCTQITKPVLLLLCHYGLLTSSKVMLKLASKFNCHQIVTNNLVAYNKRVYAFLQHHIIHGRSPPQLIFLSPIQTCPHNIIFRKNCPTKFNADFI